LRPAHSRPDEPTDIGAGYDRSRERGAAIARARCRSRLYRGPSRLFGIARKGRIAVGYDADVTVVNLKRQETITDQWSVSRAGWTPYNGMRVAGWPVDTVIRGSKVMWDGTLVGGAQGERVHFLETLAS